MRPPVSFSPVPTSSHYSTGICNLIFCFSVCSPLSTHLPAATEGRSAVTSSLGQCTLLSFMYTPGMRRRLNEIGSNTFPFLSEKHT